MLSRPDQLIAGCQNCDPWAAMHGNPRHIHCRQQPDIAALQDPPRLQGEVALAKINARHADIGAVLDWRPCNDSDGLRVGTLSIFLDQHRVRAIGDGRAR